MSQAVVTEQTEVVSEEVVLDELVADPPVVSRRVDGGERPDAAPAGGAAERAARLAQARSAPRAPRPQWQQADVVEVIEETPETATLRLALPGTPGFVAGQYYNVRYPVEGKPRPIMRAYSIGSSPLPDPSVIEITVKEMIGGLVSPRLVRDVRAGDKLEVRGPHGTFTWTEADGGPVLLIAAGSGVVPFMSVIRYAVAKKLSVRMRLLFSSKSEEFVIYAEELRRLEQEHSWLDVVHTFTRAPGHPGAAYHRRIDASMITECVESLQVGEGESPVGYACGSPEMVDAAQAALLAAGLEPDRVRVEKYD